MTRNDTAQTTEVQGAPVRYFVVVREAGPAWQDGKGAFEQPGAAEHTAFMNTLTDEGLILFAGPLAGTEQRRIRVLLVASAQAEADIHRRLANDPWARTQMLQTTSVEPWMPLVGADRLPK
jgi:uncharacterized protein YciI